MDLNSLSPLELATVVKTSSLNWPIRLSAIRILLRTKAASLVLQGLLLEAAQDASLPWWVRREAAQSIRDRESLSVLFSDPEPNIRMMAVARIKDRAAIEAVAISDASQDVRRAAISTGNVSMPVLAQIAQSDADCGLRALAADKLLEKMDQ